MGHGHVGRTVGSRKSRLLRKFCMMFARLANKRCKLATHEPISVTHGIIGLGCNLRPILMATPQATFPPIQISAVKAKFDIKDEDDT